MDELIKYAVKMDLLNVFLGLKKQAFCFLHFSLDVRYVLLESFELLAILFWYIQKGNKLLTLFDCYFLDELLGLVL